MPRDRRETTGDSCAPSVEARSERSERARRSSRIQCARNAPAAGQQRGHHRNAQYMSRKVCRFSCPRCEPSHAICIQCKPIQAVGRDYRRTVRSATTREAAWRSSLRGGSTTTEAGSTAGVRIRGTDAPIATMTRPVGGRLRLPQHAATVVARDNSRGKQGAPRRAPRRPRPVGKPVTSLSAVPRDDGLLHERVALLLEVAGFARARTGQLRPWCGHSSAADLHRVPPGALRLRAALPPVSPPWSAGSTLQPLPPTGSKGDPRGCRFLGSSRQKASRVACPTYRYSLPSEPVRTTTLVGA
jgi:hypothetical protein